MEEEKGLDWKDLNKLNVVIDERENERLHSRTDEASLAAGDCCRGLPIQLSGKFIGELISEIAEL